MNGSTVSKLSLPAGLCTFYQAAGRVRICCLKFTAVNGGRRGSNYPTRHESKVENRVARSDWFQLLACEAEDGG